MENTTRRSGKAIGGGKLTQVLRDDKVIGTVNETLGFFFAHVGGAPYVTCRSLSEAVATVRLMAS